MTTVRPVELADIPAALRLWQVTSPLQSRDVESEAGLERFLARNDFFQNFTQGQKAHICWEDQDFSNILPFPVDKLGATDQYYFMQILLVQENPSCSRKSFLFKKILLVQGLHMFNSRSVLELCELGQRTLPSVSVMNVSGNVTYQVSGTATVADQKLIDLIDKLNVVLAEMEVINTAIAKTSKSIGGFETAKLFLQSTLDSNTVTLTALKTAGAPQNKIDAAQAIVDQDKKAVADNDKDLLEAQKRLAEEKKDLDAKKKEYQAITDEIRKLDSSLAQAILSTPTTNGAHGSVLVI